MSATAASDDGAQAGAGPRTGIRVYLRASNLPKSFAAAQPDTIARISWLHASELSQLIPPPAPPSVVDQHSGTGGDGEDSTECEGYVRSSNETEVVRKSSHPRWTASFSAQYEYGSQMLFCVDVFALKAENIVAKQGSKHMGRAVFDIQDVLGSANNTKARRLRKGGVVYAHVEQISADRSPDLVSSADSPTFSLRLRADSLVHTHSKTLSLTQKVVPNMEAAKPDTYYEISRRSGAGAWVAIYRSPPVKESVSPMWDKATVELDSFRPSTSQRLSEDLSSYPIRITVFKVKTKKVKEIGSLETTIGLLKDAYWSGLDVAKVTGHGDEHSDIEAGGGQSFELRPSLRNGAVVSYEITGTVTVVKASVDSSDEVRNRSQRFLYDAVDEVPADNGGFFETNDGASNVDVRNGALPSRSGPKFSDYVRAGILDMDCCVAIDFTSSNGDPRVPGTQHYSRDGMMNDYEEAIVALGKPLWNHWFGALKATFAHKPWRKSAGSTIEKYSISQDYTVWGFGAKYGGTVRHIFQCGGSPTAKRTDGVLDAYRTVFETDLIMSGPTVISSVLKGAAARSKKFYNAPQDGAMKYCVLLILTDGIVTDLQATQDLVRSYRDLQLPLSVIVVGIGRADFSEFRRWNRSPQDARGRFTFVEFREHQFDPDTLSRKALLNVPHEVVDYFLGRNIIPK